VSNTIICFNNSQQIFIDNLYFLWTGCWNHWKLQNANTQGRNHGDRDETKVTRIFPRQGVQLVGCHYFPKAWYEDPWEQAMSYYTTPCGS